mmetsp:Transcript_23577/g.20938  ORF Transcript_23577/g.20938 Transcript_23577/m.20938 type:complete len:105 (-) Transcript_23577:18-332(-)
MSQKEGPKEMKIPLKLIEVEDEDNLKRISEPKLKDFLTIEDLKMRASILAYAKFTRMKERAKIAQIKKTATGILAIVRCKRFIKKLKHAVNKKKLESINVYTET